MEKDKANEPDPRATDSREQAQGSGPRGAGAPHDQAQDSADKRARPSGGGLKAHGDKLANAASAAAGHTDKQDR